jgi:hypothetical protein
VSTDFQVTRRDLSHLCGIGGRYYCVQHIKGCRCSLVPRPNPQLSPQSTAQTSMHTVYGVSVCRGQCTIPPPITDPCIALRTLCLLYTAQGIRKSQLSRYARSSATRRTPSCPWLQHRRTGLGSNLRGMRAFTKDLCSLLNPGRGVSSAFILHAAPQPATTHSLKTLHMVVMGRACMATDLQAHARCAWSKVSYMPNLKYPFCP